MVVQLVVQAEVALEEEQVELETQMVQEAPLKVQVQADY
jgi:hypothetical protein